MKTQWEIQKFIQRAALGQNKMLGALYDFRTDQFVPGLFFRNPCKLMIRAPPLSRDFSFDYSQLGKFKKTNVGNEQKLSLLFGDLYVEGSGRYFVESFTNDPNSITGTLKYIFPTIREQCDTLHSERNDSLISSEATHVVVGIIWGVCIYISIRLTISPQEESKKDAQKKLQALLQTIIHEAQRETHEQLDTSNQFEIKLFSDVLLPNKSPSTVDDIPSFLRQIPELIKNVNQGKGVPIEYEFFPLSIFHPQKSLFQKKKGIRFLKDKKQSVDQFDPKKSVEILFKTIERAKRDFSAFQTDCERVKEILPGKLIQELEDHNFKMQIFEVKFKKEIMDGIWTIREEGEILKLLSALHSMWDLFIKSSPDKLLKTWNFMREKLGAFAFLKNKGVIFQKTLLSYKNIIFQSSSEKAFVFFYCEDDKDQLQKNLEWFKVLIQEQNPRHCCILIDLGTLENQEIFERKSFIHEDKRGIFVCKDYASTNFILCDNEAERVSTNNNLDTYELFMACPNSLQERSCENINHEWVCENCHQKIYCDREFLLSCSCFCYSLNKARFKCSDPKHGSEFLAFDDRLISLDSGKLQDLMAPSRTPYQEGFSLSFSDQQHIFPSEKETVKRAPGRTIDWEQEDRQKLESMEMLLASENLSPERRMEVLREMESLKNRYGTIMPLIREGTQSYVWPNGDKYEGEWRNDKRDGIGTQSWVNGDWYVGDWEEDKITGGGTRTWANGDEYEGDWKDNSRTGRGKLVCKRGTYEGDWKNSQREGGGIQVWANGDRYSGDWKGNKRHGGGTQIWANGDKYEGDWEDDQRVGEGKLIKANGEVYEGDWANDKPTGQGKSYNIYCP